MNPQRTIFFLADEPRLTIEEAISRLKAYDGEDRIHWTAKMMREMRPSDFLRYVMPALEVNGIYQSVQPFLGRHRFIWDFLILGGREDGILPEVGMTGPDGVEKVKVEIAMDSSLPPTEDILVVPSLERLAAMKFCAVLGRSDLKDVIDLYFIDRHDSKSFSGGLVMAPSIDGGLTCEALAWCLSQVRIPDAPPASMLADMDMNDLKKFRDGLVSRLRKRALEGCDGFELV